MKKILVTGAAGFIGFHLSLALALRGYDVVGFDNFNDYYDPRLKECRAAILKRNSIKIYRGDLIEKESLEEIVKSEKISHIVHLAAQAGVRYSFSHPHQYISSNIEGFLNILEICRKYPHVPLVYASSSSVYGLNEEQPFSENQMTDRPTSLYGVTKKTNELMAYTYHHLFGIATTGLRFFTVYGPWGRPDMAYFSFAEAIESGNPIKLYGKEELQRDFTYIDDIIEGILSAVDHSYGCEVFNLGNHHPQPVIQLVHFLENELGKKADLQFEEKPKADVLSTFADLTKSRERLNFSPKITLSEGIHRFVDWYKLWKSGTFL